MATWSRTQNNSNPLSAAKWHNARMRMAHSEETYMWVKLGEHGSLSPRRRQSHTMPRGVRYCGG
eukprot:7335962-Lingulodinium_polyedra.AAC.1